MLYSTFSPCSVIDVAGVVPFADTVEKGPRCAGTVPPVVVGQGKRTEEKVCPSFTPGGPSHSSNLNYFVRVKRAVMMLSDVEGLQ